MATATQCARTGVVFARYVSGVAYDAIQGTVESMVVLWRQPEMWMSPMSVERIRYSDPSKSVPEECNACAVEHARLV